MVCLFVLLIATLLFALFRKDANANQKNYQEVRSEDYILLGSDTASIGNLLPTFRRSILHPISGRIKATSRNFRQKRCENIGSRKKGVWLQKTSSFVIQYTSLEAECIRSIRPETRQNDRTRTVAEAAGAASSKAISEKGKLNSLFLFSLR
jgi:hypothetical protein